MRKIIKPLIDLISKTWILQKFVISVMARTDFLGAALVNDPDKRLLNLLGLNIDFKTSQINQDIFALLNSRFKRGGYFVEVGANDGYNLSNTLLLEAEFHWNGLLIEANPKYTTSLKTRKASVEISAVSDHMGSVAFKDGGLYGGISEHLDATHEKKLLQAKEIIVQSATLTKIFNTHDVPGVIDFISIDVEGCEVSIVDQMFSADHHYEYLCGVIEVNRRQSDMKHITNILKINGYEILPVSQTKHDIFFYK